MNKFISSLAAIALVITSVVISPVTAAGISFTIASANRQNFTLDLPAGVDLEAGDVITLTLRTAANGTAVDLSANDVTAATLGAGAAETLTNNGDAAGTIVITEGGNDEAAGADLVFALTTALTDNTAYTITYSDTDSNFGAALINFGTANQVSVSATVDPILSFSLDTNTLALGSLPTAADTYANDTGTTKINPTVSSNAEGGIVVSMTSTGLKSATRESGVTDIAGGIAQTTATDYFKVSTNATPNITDANGANIATAAGTDVLASQTVYSIATPVAAGTVGVTVAARAAATTEAGNYADTLTFTATPTF